MMLCWYTRSMEDERPKGLIHAYFIEVFSDWI
jgi:hypothetical protein